MMIYYDQSRNKDCSLQEKEMQRGGGESEESAESVEWIESKQARKEFATAFSRRLALLSDQIEKIRCCSAISQLLDKKREGGFINGKRIESLDKMLPRR